MKKEKAICIFAYNRFEHLEATLRALFQSDLSQFDVYIFQDGPKDKLDAEKTGKVAKLIREFSLEQDMLYFPGKSNLGLATSVFKGLDFIFKEYEKAIILEDDILVRQGFLPFLTRALDFYGSDNNVAGIAGFSYIDEPVGKNYFLPFGTSWGWATWARSWHGIRNSPEFYMSEIEKSTNINPFNFGTYPFKEMLRSAVEGKIDSWAIQFYAHFYLKGQYFLFPSTSLCTNIGFDNSGTHTGENMKSFNSKKVDSVVEGHFPESTLDLQVVKKLSKHMKKMAQNDWRSKLVRIRNRIIK
jgi:hypothetical protein